jgi:predicted nucleotidyltransferase component of viral defense system
MISSAKQLKAKIKNMTEGLSPFEKSEKSQMLIRLFLMEGFLERVSVSKYRDNFILKGGILVSAYTGLDSRATKDIDTTFRALTLKLENAQNVLEEIIQIDLGDNIRYDIRGYDDIMEDFDYPGLRFTIGAKFDTIDYSFQIDISTDDAITPDAVEYEYKLMLEDRTISLTTYNLETLLAEKLQTIAARGAANTRIRDFYDIYMLTKLYDDVIAPVTLKDAFEATSRKRRTTEKSAEIHTVLEFFETDPEVNKNWNRFKMKNYFVENISWEDVMNEVKNAAMIVVPIDMEIEESQSEDISPALV